MMKALACADLGEIDETRRYIDYAEDHCDDPTDDRDQEWNFTNWYHHVELDGMAGRALINLASHRPTIAEEALNRATASLQHHRAEQVRTRARIHNSLVRLHATLGDPAATETAARTALDTASAMQSPRITGELMAIRPLLKRWHTRPGIAEIDREITTLATAT
jgi:hypothetical protein